MVTCASNGIPNIHRLGCLIVLICLSTMGCGTRQVPTGGNYPPVTAARLTGASYSHRTGQSEPLMDWRFTVDEMQLVAKKGALPTGLVEAILGENDSQDPWEVKKITADWSISGEKLLLDKIRHDDQKCDAKCTLRVFNTGVIRISAAGTQYVFSPSRN